MKVIWLSGRVIGNDLCSTTQVALMDGLQSRGIDCMMLSPGSIDRDWHHSVKRSKFRGFQARSVAKSILKENMLHCDLVILDWRLAKWVIPRLRKSGIPWLLMDRSPPADVGVIAKLQRRHWKRAWINSSQGCTVSKMHSDLVGKFSNAIKHIVPAGVDTESFLVNTSSDGLNLVYHGRLDGHRGIMSLLEIARVIHEIGTDVTLHLAGEGDLSQRLESMEEKWLKYHGKLPHSEIPTLLSKMDVGLSPMDDRQSWAISSPLKISEYAAAGLQVIATNHPGHHFSFNAEWVHYVELDSWVDGVVNLLSNFEPKGNPAADAAEYLDWSYSVDALVSAIEL